MPIQRRARRTRRPAAGVTRAAGVRRGMTLVEVIVAMLILVGATLSMGGFVTRFAHTATVTNVKSTAMELAADRLETVKQASAYITIPTTYGGDEATIAGYPGFRRSTVITRVSRADARSGGVDDYMLVTVVVSNGTLSSPVRKTTIISAF